MSFFPAAGATASGRQLSFEAADPVREAVSVYQNLFLQVVCEVLARVCMCMCMDVSLGFSCICRPFAFLYPTSTCDPLSPPPLQPPQVLSPKHTTVSTSIANAADESSDPAAGRVLRSSMLTSAADALCNILVSVRAGKLPWSVVDPVLSRSALQHLCWLYHHVVAAKRRGARADQAWTSSPLVGALGSLIGAYASVLYDDTLHREGHGMEDVGSPASKTPTDPAACLSAALSP